jgi:tryptophanyl-tRNA synthetase
MENKKKNVLSAIQPTGDLHLGNYFGAVKNWVAIQEEYNAVYGVVNYHTMTMPYKSAQLQEGTWKMIFMVMACGVKVENLFIQSLIPEHAELAWIFGCTCSYGELSRMTQFKDKGEQLKEGDKEAFVSAGLFYYPVLQAADILIYHADYVPVGKDQEQHLELSRNIAARFNRQFNKEYFVHPEPLYTETPKVLSLADPTRKMSKSLGEKHYVNLFGDADRIRKQVRSAVTDTGERTEIMSAGVSNLFELLKACEKLDARQSLLDDYNSGVLKYADLKEAVADALVELTQPLKEKLADIQADKKNVKSQIQDSSAEIRKRAIQTLKDVKELTGLAIQRGY